MLKILSIDDSKSVHAFIRECLAGKNVDIHDAYNGKEGILCIEDAKKNSKFDLILLDWEMPELDGFGVLKWLQENPIGIPIIMLTSKNKVGEISQMIAHGASEYIMKPFTSDILINKIESVLGKKV